MGRRISIVLLGVGAAAALIWVARPVSPVSPLVADDTPAKPGAQLELKTPTQTGSYALGYKIGQSIRRQSGQDGVASDAFVLGIQHGLSGNEGLMKEKDRERAFRAFQTQIAARSMNHVSPAGEKAKKAGDAFQAANKAKPGVKVLPSGVQYEVLKEGSGKQPKASDEVKVHYHGTLIDGTVFDSSVNRGEPMTFRLDQVIPGWTEVVQKMKEGSKWRVVIPPDSAYGANGPPQIGPNATLIFEIELLEVK